MFADIYYNNATVNYLQQFLQECNMVIDQLCRLYFPTHKTSVQINTITDRVYVFKYNDSTCDYDIFESFEDAQPFIETAL